VLVRDENATLRRKANQDAALLRLAEVPQRLYDSEINFVIATFWDCGYRVRLGDDLNGYRAEGEVRTYVEALAWLMRRRGGTIQIVYMLPASRLRLISWPSHFRDLRDLAASPRNDGCRSIPSLLISRYSTSAS
jgi:hypothetical protein